MLFAACSDDDSNSNIDTNVTVKIHFLNGYSSFSAPQMHFFATNGSANNVSSTNSTADGSVFVTNIRTSGTYGFTFLSGASWENGIVGQNAKFDRLITIPADVNGDLEFYAVSWNKIVLTNSWSSKISNCPHNVSDIFGGSYVLPGCTRVGSDFLFSVFAPNSSRAQIAGEFTSWQTSAVDMYYDHIQGYWWKKLAASAAVAHGKQYKYILDDNNWAPDPYGRAFYESSDYNSQIVDNSYTWGDGSWSRPAKSSLVIYEMHVKDFTHGDSGYSYPTGAQGNYLGMKAKIPYLVSLGVNAVEIMPIQEWPGGYYSWGYNNNGYFAPENSLASDGHANDTSAVNEFKELVDALHQAGIAVILDVVYNHTATEGNSLWAIDNNYFFDVGNNTDWGNRVEMRNPRVQKFFIDNMKYWMDEYHVDGFRLDATGEIDAGSTRYLVKQLKDNGYANRYYIFEEFEGGHNSGIQSFNSAEGGPYISSWGTGYKYAIWGAVNNGWDGSLGKVTYYSKDDGWNYQGEVINYFSSHDEGTLAGRQSASVQKVKMAAVHLLTSMGIPMVWMGDEVHRLHYGNYPSSGSGIDEANNTMDWDTLKTAAATSGILDFYSGLIKLRIAHPNLHMSVADPGNASVDDFNWNMSTDQWNGSVLSYTYKGSGDNGFVVFINYGSSTEAGRTATVPVDGTWHVMCDGSSAVSDVGSALGTVTASGGSLSYDVPANSGIILMSDSTLP